MFSKILIANRGEISCRISRTAHLLGIKTVAVFSDADANALHVLQADEALRLGPAPSRESYLCIDKIIAAAKATNAEAIHPGYGFLSENSEFAQACADNGIKFIGPSAAAILAMGSKSGAKALMEKAGVPLVPGYHGDNQEPDFLLKQAKAMGFPVLLKASAGGGGKGMRAVHHEVEFMEALQAAQREALNAFGDQRMLVEKLLVEPRHVEVQILADAHGNAVYVFDRDCSIQRRHQKVVEEAPAPSLSNELRKAMGEAAVRAAKAIHYEGAGTLEFLVDKNGHFYFMEMNTRLQVEHPVSELISGLDLVELQIRIANGDVLPFTQSDLQPKGHAVEVRLYAEDPQNEFLPSTGKLRQFSLPQGNGIRVDTGYKNGDLIGVHYDPMMAKVIAWGESRTQAIARLCLALEKIEVAGVRHNAAFLAKTLAHPNFINAEISTHFIDTHQEDLLKSTHSDNHYLLIAALYALQKNSTSTMSSPWQTLNNFRIGSSDSFNCYLRYKGQPYTVSLIVSDHTISYRIGDEQGHCHLQLPQTGIALLTLNGHSTSYGLLPQTDHLDIFFRGECAEVIYDSHFPQTHTTQNDKHYKAPMNGRVVAVNVAEGSSVNAGDTLLVMEAMKMEHRIRAHQNGIAQKITVQAGDLVNEGQILAEIETLETSQ